MSNPWKPVEGFESVQYARYIVPNFASNSIAVAQSNESCCVISPGESVLRSFHEQYPLIADHEGQGLDLVMPNAYHYLGVSAWLKHYPKARLFASVQASERLTEKGFENIEPLQDGQSGPVEGSVWRVPPGHRGGDVWLILAESDKRLWVTCDSFLHYPRMSNQPIARLVQRVMGAAPGLKLSRVIKYLLLTDRRAFKRWCLEALESSPPDVLLPSHGDVLMDKALPQKLSDLISDRL